ncbi:hypothetical protein AMECASPLE_029139 [Ameca splendens]|uniref:Uncharacterized protein n=1 Tax=Ameca splendens TaxID=208324 RepID=A0ABV0YTJ8_9TELE
MPLPAPCLTSLVPIIDPVSVPGLLSQSSPWIIQPKATRLSYLHCGDLCLPPTEVSPLGFKFNPRQKQMAPDAQWKLSQQVFCISLIRRGA